jgi:hypothetical protein
LLEQGMQLAFSDLFRDIFQGVACELIRTLTQRPEVVRPGPTDRKRLERPTPVSA